MMGLTRREAQRRLGAVIEFAELEEFVDLKLKNYSSGMMVRFAFAVMVQADADIMLIDEVLAVGDAAFAQNAWTSSTSGGPPARRSCSSRTTWRPSSRCATGRCCSRRASKYSGDPDATALRYYRLNFAGLPRADGADSASRWSTSTQR